MAWLHLQTGLHLQSSLGEGKKLNPSPPPTVSPNLISLKNLTVKKAVIYSFLINHPVHKYQPSIRGSSSPNRHLHFTFERK